MLLLRHPHPNANTPSLLCCHSGALGDYLQRGSQDQRYKLSVLPILAVLPDP